MLALCGLTLLPTPATAIESPQLTGSLRSLNLASRPAPAGGLPESRLSSNSLRLTADGTAWSGWQVEAAIEHRLLWTDPGRLLPQPEQQINRRADLDHDWRHADHWTSQLQIDRLSLRKRFAKLDLTIGRQAFGFGRILLFSPLDLVLPFAPEALDKETRNGIDAVRTTAHYSLDGQLGGLLIWGDRVRHNSLLATWSDNRGGVDLLAVAGRLRSRPVVGFGLAGSLGSLGLKGEVALYQGQRTSRPDGDLHDRFAIGAMEGWYRFASGITLVAQYLYNGPGVGTPADHPRAALSAPLREGLTFLLGRHYLLLAPSYEPHPLATLQGLLIWNLEDDSALFRPSMILNLHDNLDLELFWTGVVGGKPRPSAPGFPSTPTSEFGLRGANAGLWIRYFF
ncbi:MAG: hypothetical protein RQ723_11685 [Desulfuromonadales bacterium]|nr:hypothetical protein [Desulfuromonadales bacterium]